MEKHKNLWSEGRDEKRRAAPEDQTECERETGKKKCDGEWEGIIKEGD